MMEASIKAHLYVTFIVTTTASFLEDLVESHSNLLVI
jgi:hypothetical protein